MWELQLPALDGHEVTTPRLYELGASMDEWATKVAPPKGSFVAVGASMGGYAAAAIARRMPERLAGLVLAGSRADADPPERREAREQALRLVAEGGAAALWEEMQRGPFSGTPEDVRRRLTAIAEAQTPQGLSDAIAAIRDRPDARAAIAALPVPFLIVVGDRDPLVSPEEAHALAASAPDGRAEVFEDSGHLPSYEQPERFNSVLRSFLEGLG